MIDRLPADVLLDIIDFLNSNTKIYPPYVYRNQSILLQELTCVCKLLRQKLLPIHVKHLSLVRKKEYTTKTPDSGVLKSVLRNIEGAEGFVQELEIHSSQLSVLDMFYHLKSLNVLGLLTDKILDLSHLEHLEHLSFRLPSSPLDGFNFSAIKRLDLFIESDINSLAHLQLPQLVQLNLTTTDMLSLLILHPFVSLLKRSEELKSLALIRKNSRVNTRGSANSIHHDHVEIDQFFDALKSMSLEIITIDSAIIRNSCGGLDYTRQLEDKITASDLHFELIEQSFVSLSSIEQRLTTLEFLMNIPYKIVSMKLIYGVQIELPYDTSLKYFIDLFHPLINEEHGENNSIQRYSSLKSIVDIYTLMAWNLTEDQRLEEFQHDGADIMTYTGNTGLFNPNYKKMNKSTIKFRENSILLVKDFKSADDYDARFWSIETISKDLQNFSKVRRSFLWD